MRFDTKYNCHIKFMHSINRFHGHDPCLEVLLDTLGDDIVHLKDSKGR